MELYIVSAYLTGWKPSHKLNSACQEICFIVGTDFGITAKAACRNVLKWMPQHFKSEFRAADRISSGFHPKLVAWKDVNGQCHMVLGSSNLTEAAFTTNYEANVFAPISQQKFKAIKEWVQAIAGQSSPISEEWLEQYEERSKGIRRKQANETRFGNPVLISPRFQPGVRRREKIPPASAVSRSLISTPRRKAAGTPRWRGVHAASPSKPGHAFEIPPASGLRPLTRPEGRAPEANQPR